MQAISPERLERSETDSQGRTTGRRDTSGRSAHNRARTQASTEGSRATKPTALRVENSARAGRIARPLHEVIDALGRLKQRVFDPDAFSGQTKQRAPQIPPGARFETRSIISSQGQRFFKLYVPARPFAEPRSLLIMLHGCTQTPEDFAAGTRMNELAEQNGFIVAYPAQPKSANPSACWNWFNPQNQTRGMGEAAVIVAQAQSLIAEFGIDPRRVFVAGMSAGGAMAAIMAAIYPDAFSALVSTRACHTVGFRCRIRIGGHARERCANRCSPMVKAP